MSATAVALSALAMHASSWLVSGVPLQRRTRAGNDERPDADRSGRETARPYAGACLVLLRGPRGNPGPSTDFSVTDGLRWNGSRIACHPPISQNARFAAWRR